MKLFNVLTDVTQTQETTESIEELTCSVSGSTIITFANTEVYKNSLLINDAIDSEHPEIISLEFGITTDSSFYEGLSGSSLFDIRESAYKKYAKILLDDQDGRFTLGSGANIEQAYFINLARYIKVSEIKKASFNIDVNYSNIGGTLLTGSISDISQVGETTLTYQRNLNSEYRTLYFSNGTTSVACGTLFYQPGIAVIDPSAVFVAGATQIWTAVDSPTGSTETFWYTDDTAVLFNDGDTHINDTNINVYYGFLERITEIDFTSTNIEFSSNYFVKAEAGECNYSSNPTYINSNGDIVVVAGDINNVAESYTYITSVGLYDDNENLLAVSKLSKPLKKDWSQARLLKIRIGN